MTKTKKTFPKKTTITITVDTDKLLKQVRQHAKYYGGIDLNPDNYDSFVRELTRDICGVSLDNPDFFPEAFNNDMYLEFLKENEE